MPSRLKCGRVGLVAIADEATTRLLRTAFSTIIRESNDQTVALMKTSSQTIAESHAGIPAFAALMSVLIWVDPEPTVVFRFRVRGGRSGCV